MVFNFEVHDGADPRKSVCKRGKQSAIAEAGVRGCVDRLEKRLDFTIDECRRFAFGPRKSLGLGRYFALSYPEFKMSEFGFLFRVLAPKRASSFCALNSRTAGGLLRLLVKPRSLIERCSIG